MPFRGMSTPWKKNLKLFQPAKMSEDSLRSDVSAFEGSEEIDPELLAEYQRELERHEAAQRMVRLKEQEALEAKRR
jgi:hypothetical protein